MKTVYGVCISIILLFAGHIKLMAQAHLANGEKVLRGNRLIAAKSESGKQLKQQERYFFKRNIITDGILNEPEWQSAQVVAPFVTAHGKQDNTKVRVLYDEEKIYLFWEIDQPDGVSSQMVNKDSIITNDDYVQVDIKPWLPDSVLYGRDYSYSIAINPNGFVWDSYYDPYLGGFYFSSWNSEAIVATRKHENRWELEMTISYKDLDIVSDPGWKWNLEFHHGSYDKGRKEISSANIGVTVEQNIMVRQPGFVSYYWSKPDFLSEIKKTVSETDAKPTGIAVLDNAPLLNNKEDDKIWDDKTKLSINHSDKEGILLQDNIAYARIGLFKNKLCFNLNANSGKIRLDKDSVRNPGAGMAAQMAGVNGVFVDQSLFQKESFWIILQPRNRDADKIHQDYYLIVINNHGEIKGTHYDQYGTPVKDWVPKTDLDIYNTKSGWGVEMNLELASLDISPENSNQWGINIFRNRLINETEYEVQAWRSTINDFLNPVKFGELSGMEIKDLAVFQQNLQRKIHQADSLLSHYYVENPGLIQTLQKELKAINIRSVENFRDAEVHLRNIDQRLSAVKEMSHYHATPHPKGHGYPLMDIQFIGNHGWAVGAMGTVLLTEDEGHSWKKINIESDADLCRVKFVNEKEGWTAGGRMRMGNTNESMRHDQRGGLAYIYHTKDGGKTWECQFAEGGRYLFALDFVDNKIGYACGERGYCMKTMDGGKHWKILSTTGTLDWLYGMKFISADTGFAVGLNSTVLKTVNGGNSWVNLSVPSDKKFYGFRSIYRDISFNGNTGCIVGQNGTVLMSYDKGNNWEPSATTFSNEIRELMDLRSVKFVTPLRGYAAGELGTKIMTTEDGGKNWVYRTTENDEWVRSIWADKKGKLFVAGEREKIMQSSDYGLHWKKLHGDETKVDILVMMAHGDDAAINLNSFMAYYAINQNKKIVNLGVVSNLHSSEYEETYDLEMDRNTWMVGVGTSTNFSQFETGNNGANYYHYNQRLWEGEENIDRHMVAAIRAYKPDIVITHDGVFGDYDKSEHKISGRAGLRAFQSAGGDIDLWPELTRIGLKPWQPKKLYNLAGDKNPPQSYPATIDLTWIGNQKLNGTQMTCKEFGNYVIRNFQSQGVYVHTGETKLALIKSNIPIVENEKTVFDGLKK